MFRDLIPLLADRYRVNAPDYIGLCDRHAYFRQHQPKTLGAWGRGDPFFGVPGAEAYRRDLSDVRVELLDSGHFALEEDALRVAELIKQTF